jgi:hypothetical protein
LVEFSLDGMHDPLTELRRKGFDIGMTVGKKQVPGKKNTMMTDVFTVHSAYVDPGAETFRVVALMPVLASAASSSAAPATLNVVPMKLFLSDFMVVTSQDIQVLHPGWPSKAPWASASYLEHSYKGFVQGALVRAARSLWEACGVQAVKILSKPSRLVMASANIKKGMLAFVPETFKITALAKLEPGLGPVAKIVSELPPGVSSLWVLGQSFSDDFVAPAWAVKMTEDLASANMEWTTMRVTMAVVTDLPQAVIRTQSKYSTLQYAHTPACMHMCGSTVLYMPTRYYSTVRTSVVYAHSAVQ